MMTPAYFVKHGGRDRRDTGWGGGCERGLKPCRLSHLRSSRVPGWRHVVLLRAHHITHLSTNRQRSRNVATKRERTPRNIQNVLKPGETVHCFHFPDKTSCSAAVSPLFRGTRPAYRACVLFCFLLKANQIDIWCLCISLLQGNWGDHFQGGAEMNSFLVRARHSRVFGEGIERR